MTPTTQKYMFYAIKHKQKDGKWVFSNLDSFGYPDGFTASGECWQQTGECGTFNFSEAVDGLKWISEKHPSYSFCLVRIEKTIKTSPILSISAEVPR